MFEDPTLARHEDPYANRFRISMAIGFGCLAVFVVLVVAVVFLLPNALRQFGQALAAASNERDRLVAETLAKGDAAAAYENADERFRAQYTQDELAAFLENHPAVLNPPRMSVSFNSQSRNNQTVVSTTFELNDVRYFVYASKENQQYHLLGISPELDGAVPAGFRRDLGEVDPGWDVEDDLDLEF